MENELHLPRKTINRIVFDYNQQVNTKGVLHVDLSSKKTGRVGRKNTITSAQKRGIHRTNTLTKGTASLRMMASTNRMSLSKVFRYVKSKFVTYKTKWIKPKLSEDHKKRRISFILGLKDVRKRRSFKEQKNVIVIDESWFYLFTDKSLIRVFPGEELPPSIKIQHKSHIPKLMFLTALARPDPEHGFDGKIGIWRVQEQKICMKSNRYHRAGDVYYKDCNMNGKIYQKFMMNIFSAIKTKMPWLQGQEVIVQQDGAPSHKTQENMNYFATEGQKNGWNINVITQPAQSPDLNINDLGFFRSLKCRVEHLKNGRQTINSLYESVLQAWQQYDSDTLQRIWGVQYACYREILRIKGDNEYKTPHTGVRKRGGEIDLTYNEQEFGEAENFVNDN